MHVIPSARSLRATAGAAVAATFLLAACGGTSADDDAGAPDDVSGQASDQASGDAGTADGAADAGGDTDPDGWPRTVTSCGREVTIESRPERVIGIDGAAETAFALGLGDQVLGWFGAPQEELPDDYAGDADSAEHYGGTFPAPAVEAILEPEPDLLLLYGYNSETGLTQERLDELGVPHLLLTESCPDETRGATLDDYYTDVETIATALGDADAGEDLITSWQDRIAAATEEPPDGEPRIYVNGNMDPAEPFASTAGSIADDQIRLAGGVNIFADVTGGFSSPSWEEIASRDPEVIVDSSGGEEESLADLKAYLADDPALSQMTAVQDDAFLALPYEAQVPGPRAVDGAVALAEFLRR